MLRETIGSDTPRLGTYKMSFGAVNEPLLYAEKSYGTLAKIVMMAYAKGKHLNKRLKFRFNKKHRPCRWAL